MYFSEVPNFKMTLSLLILMTLMTCGATLDCNSCRTVKFNGIVDQDESVACEAEGASIETCEDGQDICATITMNFKNGSDTMDQTVYMCGSKKVKACEMSEQENKGSTDFTCSASYCETDLCNAGQAVKISFLMIAATIALFGLVY